MNARIIGGGISCHGGIGKLMLFVALAAFGGCGEKPPAGGGPGKDTRAANTAEEKKSESGDTATESGPDLKAWEVMLKSDDYQEQVKGAAQFDRLAKMRMSEQATEQQALEAVVIIKGQINERWGKLGGSLEQLSTALIYLDGKDLKETRTIVKEHEMAHVRKEIVKALGKRGNRDDKSRYVGLFAQVEPQVEAAVQALVEVLKTDAEPDVREQAAQALAHIGPDAKSALPALGEVMQDEEANLRVRVAAGAAAGNISEKPTP